MVRGLDLFKAHFREFADRYVLIGGTACDLVMDRAGLPFRATKDLDIVLCIEVLDVEFAKRFWEFVRLGGYQIQEKSNGGKQFYRFKKPADSRYPFMIELFSRVPDALSVASESHLTPIPTDDEISSLSAILLDGDYYNWIHASKILVEGIFVVGAECLIPLKAKAWLDLSFRRGKGDASIDSKQISKHCNDVFRLSQLLSPNQTVDAPRCVKEDLARFLAEIQGEQVETKNLGIRARTKDQIVGDVRRIYGIDS